uniref:Chromo domain-containing protein n=1 Tax=Caenorhabditis tropicalis TaxID=1561998 RepID=A0A1I7TM73_9PELO
MQPFTLQISSVRGSVRGFYTEKNGKTSKRQEDGSRRTDVDDEEDEWPSMPPGYRILTREEQELKRKEEELRKQAEVTETFQPTATEILNDMRTAASEYQLSSLLQDVTEENHESGDNHESLLSAFEDGSRSPPTCSIVVDTVPNDDDLLFPGPVRL